MKKLIEILKKLFNSSKKGFTLIELLVVIGILGILAAALVATIDPFEQLNKAQDANVKNTLVEYITANVRYYTTHSAMPWLDTANVAATACVTGGAPSAATLGTMTAAGGCIPALISDGELKSSFTSVANILSQIRVTGGATNVISCFAPKSKSQKNDPNAKFNADGSLPGPVGCPNATLTTCYWCSQ